MSEFQKKRHTSTAAVISIVHVLPCQLGLRGRCKGDLKSQTWKEEKKTQEATLPPTNMEVQKGPLREESSLRTSMLAGGRVPQKADASSASPVPSASGQSLLLLHAG